MGGDGGRPLNTPRDERENPRFRLIELKMRKIRSEAVRARPHSVHAVQIELKRGRIVATISFKHY